MHFRKKILPRTIQDWAATFFLSTMIPLTFWFELWIVVPEIHPPGTILHSMYFVLGIFLLFNVTSNFLAVLMTDTSTRPHLITPPEDPKAKGWHLCASCEALSPPRSWHCSICDSCILKRDHHCIFTGCCIGFHNHRYFMVLLFYLFIATTLSSIYNSYFIWFLHGMEFRNLVSVTKIIFPLAMLLIDTSSNQYFLVIYLVNLIGALFTGVLLYYHANLISRGSVVHEKSKNTGMSYTLGTHENWKLVLGEKYYRVWISPFIESKLTHDGINWKGVALETEKNR